MSKEKTKPKIDLSALQRLTPSQQAAKLEQSLKAMREELEEIERSQVVSQRVMDLEFCF
jgi:Spy/CpxP family protein refolding chaperone